MIHTSMFRKLETLLRDWFGFARVINDEVEGAAPSTCTDAPRKEAKEQGMTGIEGESATEPRDWALLLTNVRYRSEKGLLKWTPMGGLGGCYEVELGVPAKLRLVVASEYFEINGPRQYSFSIESPKQGIIELITTNPMPLTALAVRATELKSELESLWLIAHNEAVGADEYWEYLNEEFAEDAEADFDLFLDQNQEPATT